jgi:transcriptional regulator with XRE-family HTH domain
MSKIVLNKEFVQRHMESSNLSSNQLARNIGISEATLSRVLNNQRNPGPKVITKMISYFGVKFEKVFSSDE